MLDLVKFGNVRKIERYKFSLLVLNREKSW